MDNPVQGYEFLDLSGLDEADLSHLRLLLGTNPHQQSLTLPWSEDVPASETSHVADSSDCGGSSPTGDGSIDWVASTETSATQIQYAMATLPPPTHAFLPPPFFSSGSPTCQWLQPIPAGENGGVHLDLTSDIEPTSGDETNQSTLQDVPQSVAPSSSMHQSVVATSQPITSHSEAQMMHAPPATVYAQPPDEQHAVYSTVPYNVVYQHPMGPAYHHPSVTPFPMIDPSQQQQSPREQTRGRGRNKSMNKSRDNVHPHSQDMRHMSHSYDYATQYYPPYQAYAQYPPMHQAAGSHIYLPAYLPFEYHPSMGVPHQGVPAKVSSQHSYPPTAPVSVPVQTPVPAPTQMPTVTAPLPSHPMLPPPIIPVVANTATVPDVLPTSAPVISAPVTLTAPPVPVPGSVVVPSIPAPVPVPAPIPVSVSPLTSVPAPTPASSQPPTITSADSKVTPSGPGITTSEQAKVSIARAGGPPAGAVLSGRRPPADPKKPILTPKVEVKVDIPSGPQPPEEKLSPAAAQQVSSDAPVAPSASLPTPAAASLQPSKSPSPEPPATVPAPTSAVAAVKTEDAPATTSTGSPWGRQSFASLFSKESSNTASTQSSFSSNSNSTNYTNQRSDGPQAISPPTQSGWGPMQPPHKANISSQQQSRSYPLPGAIPSGVAPGLPPPNPVHDPKLHRLSEYLHVCKLEHKPASLQPRGLTNRNNWCYINATLQALLACPPFYNLFINMPDTPTSRSPADSRTPIIDSMKTFVKEFSPLPAQARLKRADRAARNKDGEAVFDIQTGSAFEPLSVYRMLSVIRTDTMVEGRQEDAEEFLSCLLNGLNDEMLELMKMTGELPNGDVTLPPALPTPANGETDPLIQEEDSDEWKVMGPKNKGSITRRADFGRTPLSDIFRGQLRSRVVRSTHENNITDNVQPFFTLQLDIENSSSVKKALELYVKSEQLEGVTCSRSNQEVTAWQEVQLEELPPVLLLHLKCFDYSHEGCSKIIKPIQYDIDLRVDSKLLSSKKTKTPSQQHYKLFAVVYHDGKEATKGHYITDAFHVGYNSWIRYDDSNVKVVSSTQVLAPRSPRMPYLLYYRRQDTIDRH